MQGVYQVSIRRACDVLQFQKSTYFYKARRPSQAALRNRIREICATRVRYGNRRVHVLLQREGWRVNAKRVYRLYVEEGLQIRNKRPKRKVAAERPRTVIRRARQTMSGRWTSCRTSCSTGARSAC